MKKIIIVSMFLIICFNLFALEDLNVFYEMNKFLGENGNTIFDINYQVYYKDVVFKREKVNFIGDLRIDYAFLKLGKPIKSASFEKKIGAQNELETNSEIKYFLDKLAFKLNNSLYEFSLKITDLNSGKTNEKIFSLKTIEDNKIGGIEFSSNIEDRVIPQLQGFVRDGKTYFVNPSHIFSLDLENIYAYFEIYDLEKLYSVKLVKKNKEVLSQEIALEGKDGKILFPFNIKDFEEGYYTFKILEDEKILLSENLLLKDYFKFNFRMFYDIDKEFELIKYFSKAYSKRKWKHLDEKGKELVLNDFWLKNDPNPTTKVNEFYEIVKDRIEYANENFKGFTDGWKTPKGRIYLKNGEADDIVTGSTTERSRYMQKDYEIWNYYSSGKSYIFLNFDHKYKLVYVKNDTSERSMSNWQDVLGDDFDMSLVDF